MTPPTPHNYRNDLVLRAARGETTPRTPVWFMRQAGRFDPEYRKLKAQSSLTLLELFRTPEWAARISLLPKRLGVDALIIFQDILTPLLPMGVRMDFSPGPTLEHPVRTAQEMRALHAYDTAEELAYVGETFRLVREALAGEMPVLGFAGGPMTLATFLLEGERFTESAETTVRIAAEQPRLLHELLDKLTRLTIEYLLFQIEAGAALVQLFESAAHLVTPTVYRTFGLPYQQCIFERLKGKAPAILFARNLRNLDLLAASGADVLSLPSTVSIREARERLGEDLVVQGNLDNALLARGTLDEITAAVRACMAAGERRGHIFNLSHGVLPETPYENLLHVVRLVHGEKNELTGDERADKLCSTA